MLRYINCLREPFECCESSVFPDFAQVKYKTGSDGVMQAEVMLNRYEWLLIGTLVTVVSHARAKCVVLSRRVKYRRTSRKKMKQDLMAEAMKGLDGDTTNLDYDEEEDEAWHADTSRS